MDNITSSTSITNTGIPQGCILSLISSSSEGKGRSPNTVSTYRVNHLNLNTHTKNKNKEILNNFRKVQTTQHSVLSINREEVKWVASSKFFCLPIRGPEMERKLRPHHQESPAAPLHPEISGAQQPSPCSLSSAEKLLPFTFYFYHGEHPDIWLYCLVLQLHGSREEGITAGHQNNSGDCKLPVSEPW